ncbi:MAG: hypothetical protein ABIH37_05545 [archaeon]
MKKEKVVLIVSFVIILLLAVNFISANMIIDQTTEYLKEGGGSLFSILLNHDDIDETLFAKILLFFLFFAIVYMVLQRVELFNYNTTMVSIIAVIVSLLSIRYIGDGDFIRGLLLPYSALGAAIIIFLPLMVFFWFIQDSGMGPFGRRAGWFIYGVIFLTMWGMRMTGSVGESTDLIYMLGIGFVILSFMFDGTIHRYFQLSDYKKAEDFIDATTMLKLQEDYERARKFGTPKTVRRIQNRMRRMGLRS